MSRVTRSRARPGMIYVHFGAVTLILTAALAWFANGEQQRSEAQRLAAAEAAQTSRNQAASDDAPSTEREMRDGRSGGSWGPEPRPPRFDEAIPGTTARRARPLGTAASPPPTARTFAPPALASTDASLLIMPGVLAEVPQATASPTPEQIAEMLRRSALRAGGADRPPEL